MSSASSSSAATLASSGTAGSGSGWRDRGREAAVLPADVHRAAPRTPGSRPGNATARQARGRGGTSARLHRTRRYGSRSGGIRHASAWPILAGGRPSSYSRRVAEVRHAECRHLGIDRAPRTQGPEPHPEGHPSMPTTRRSGDNRQRFAPCSSTPPTSSRSSTPTARGVPRARPATGFSGWPPGHDPGVPGNPRVRPSTTTATSWKARSPTSLTGARGPESTVVLRVEAADGAWRHLETAGTRPPRRPRDSAGIVVTSRDVTERRARGGARTAAVARARGQQRDRDACAISTAECSTRTRWPGMSYGVTEGDAAARAHQLGVPGRRTLSSSPKCCPAANATACGPAR